MVTSSVSRRKTPGSLVLGSYKFLPYINMSLKEADALRVCAQLAIENTQTLKVRAAEVRCPDNTPIIGTLSNILREIPVVSMDLKLISDEGSDFDGIKVENVSLSSIGSCTFVIVTDFLKNKLHVDDAVKCVQDGGYIIAREHLSQNESEATASFTVIATILTDDEKLVLLEPLKRKIFGSPKIVKIESNHYDWIDELRDAAKETSVILFSQSDPTSGLIGLVNCLRKEPEYRNIRAFFIDDDSAPPFSLDNPFYIKQLKLGLAVNVYRNVSDFFAH